MYFVMPPPPPTPFTQADVARAIRAGKKEGADAVQLCLADGTITFLLKGEPLVPPAQEDVFAKWEREYEQAKAARTRERDSEAR